MKIKYTYSFFLIWFSIVTWGQETIIMDINTLIDTAKENSIQTSGAKSNFRASLWQFKSYKAEFLPSLTFNTTPLNYNRSINKRYNFNTNQDEYREIQNLENYVGLSIRQNVGFLGGTFYIDSNLDRLESLAEGKRTSYSSTPIRIGYDQKLFGFNRFKWMKLSEPIKYELAQKKYTENLERVSEEAMKLYFEVAISNVSLKLAEKKASNADSLSMIANRRSDIGTINLNDVQQFVINKMNADMEVEKHKRNVKRASLRLSSFLRKDEKTFYDLTLPEELPNIIINDNEIAALLNNKHPKMLALKLKELDAEKALSEAKTSRWGNANLNLSYGLNQTNDRFSDVFLNPLDQQKVKISLEIPILDWGLSKGKYKIALSNRDEVLSEIEQEKIDHEEEMRIQLLEFNSQKKMVTNSKRAKDFGEKVYRTTKKRYLNGHVDYAQLKDAEFSWAFAEENYINALKEYWTKYYTLRRLTLYDFKTKTSIDHSIEELKF